MARDIDVAVRQAHTKLAIDLAVSECVENNINTARNMTELWHTMSEEAREKLAEEADRRARATLQELSEALGSSGFTRIPALLESFNQGKTNVAKLVVPDDADRHALGDAKGSKVTIVLTHADTFKDAPTAKDVDSNQGDLLAGIVAAIAEDGGDEAGDGVSSGVAESDDECEDNKE